jgi:glutamate/tyrosine decarboxylase-like PLP-dependent enzyme
MAARLAEDANVRILNALVLNQVLVQDAAPNGATSDARTAAVIQRVQEDGTCWVGGTTWHGMHVMRVSISNWSTTVADIDASAAAILRCAAQVPA